MQWRQTVLMCSSLSCTKRKRKKEERKEEKPASFKKNALGEAVKIIHFIKLNPWVFISVVFCVTEYELCTAYFCVLKYNSFSGRSTTWLLGVLSWNSCFFPTEHYCYLKKEDWQIWLSRLEYLADVFSKINEVSLLLQGYHLTVIVANDKIWVLRKKMRVLENLYPLLIFLIFFLHDEFDSFSRLNGFPDEITRDINEYELFILYN